MMWAVAPILMASAMLRQPTFSHPDRVRYDGHCFTIDGKAVFLFSGAFHYFRCPRELWRERFQRIKDAGFNAVETYVAWNWSERDKPSGPDDYSHVDLKDLDDWLSMAENEFGLYTIVRPGPYICSEWASGGFPNWLPTFRPAHTAWPMWYRGDDPVFETWSRHWYTEVAGVVRKHQLTHKPKGAHGVILWQVENEYDFDGFNEEVKRAYIRYLITATKDLGIDVPIFTCWTSVVRFPKGDPILSQAYDNPNEYPRWNIEEAARGIEAQHEAQPWAPKMVTEFQGGWFGGVGSLAAEEQDGVDDKQIKALTVWSIANGLTGLNYYMLFGGTNFGDWAGEGITTSYDYAAPIREWGGGGPKYRAVKAVGDFLKQYGPDVARSEAAAPPGFDTLSGKVRLLARKGADGATYVFFWNPDRNNPAKGNLAGQVPVNLGPFGVAIYRFMEDPSLGRWCAETQPGHESEPLYSAPVQTAQVTDLMPADWRDADPAHPTSADLGVWDSRFLAYRFSVPVKPGAIQYAQLASKESDVVGASHPLAASYAEGQTWAVHPGDNDFFVFNKGWPNGGQGMEEPHGLRLANGLSELPKAQLLGSWHTKMLPDQSDRSLTAEGVDTTAWVEGTGTELFLPHTTGVLRTSFDFQPTPGKKVYLACGGVDDYGWFYLNGHLVGQVHQYNVSLEMDVTSVIKPGHNEVAIVIQNVEGAGGLTGQVAVYEPLPTSAGYPFKLKWTDRFLPGVYQTYALSTTADLPIYDHPKLTGDRPTAQHLVRSTIRFDCPTLNGAWEMVLKAGGDGFLTLNGHPLGRYWEVGPQRAYFLPRPWLRAHNVLELTVLPGHLGDRITAAELRALPMDE
jgi:hypothetical protein